MYVVNDQNYLDERIDLLSGSLTGIWENNDFFVGDAPYPLPTLNYITSNLVNIQKNINLKDRIIYHLSGYGSNYNEAKLSFLGESAERYSFALMPLTLNEDITVASYNQLVDKYGVNSVLPLEYINIFDKDSDMSFINGDDEIQWVKMNKLLNPEEVLFEPAQLVMFYHKSKKEKTFNKSAVSTGTACNEHIESALENALIEYLQIDSVNLWWYGGHKGKKISVNLDELFRKYFNCSSREFEKFFTVKFTDISFDKGLWVIACEILSENKRPHYIMGVQGGFSKEQVIYRSFMETLTVMAYAMKMSWINTDFYDFSKKAKIDNLDKNVAYYAIKGKPVLKSNLKNLNYKKKVFSLRELINVNKEKLQWSAFSNITPIEFKNLNLEVVRIICPELLPVAMPDYPPKNHPRYKLTGGIINEFAHPMA